MTSRKRLATVAAIAMALTFTTQALAQRKDRAPAPNIAGAWSFQTAPYDADGDGRACSMKGTMTIAPTRTTGDFTCVFTAIETCPWGEWTAEQTCTAKRNGAKLEITSTITRVTPATVNYAPDNWSLTIRTSDLMIGELRSADIADVQFRRGPAYVS